MLSVSNNLTAPAGFSFSWDLLVFAGAIATIFAYGIFSGKGKIFTLLLATYFSFLITTLAPWKQIGDFFNYEKDFPSATFQAFIFLILIVAFCFLLPHSVLGSVSRIGRGGGRGSWWQAAVFSFLEVGLLSSIILSFLPAKNLTDINYLFKQFFIGQMPYFIWMFLPILALTFLRRGRMD